MWECFTKLLEEVGATSDTCGGVEATVDRYLFEPLINYKTDGRLEWWNENKCRFSYLFQLACALPISVPSE